MPKIDLKQFHATFFAESLGALDATEKELLRIEAGEGDADSTHAVFRAVHSIKGASGTFGFQDIARLAHALETLLDGVRDGRTAIESRLIDSLLRAVDCLRDAVVAARDAAEAPAARIDALIAELETFGAGSSGAVGDKPAPPAAAAARELKIHFRPHVGLLRTGNDPLRLLRVLADMGTLSVELHRSGLPDLPDMDPETSYLAWDLKLTTAASTAEVEEVFAWVADDCELTIEEPLPEAVAVVMTRAGDADARRSDNHQATLHVSAEKVDNLMNLVGELVITLTILKRLGDEVTGAVAAPLQSALAQLERDTRELQHSVMSIRMLPASFAFNRFARLVRDIAKQLGKQVQLQVSGEEAELDKTVIERLIDPLTHLVRNSLDHGIESPDARAAAGKPAFGTIYLHAEHKGGNIVIQVRDDGRGLDRERIRAKAVEMGLVTATEELAAHEIDQLIFLPGFSTAEHVSDVSGRGVGMDVVYKNVNALGGRIDIDSQPGQGTCFTLRLPLTLAIVDGMSVALGGETYILPLTFIVESMQPRAESIRAIAGQARLVDVRGDYVPLVELGNLLGGAANAPVADAGILVLLEAEGRRVALKVDSLLGQDQVVIKSLEANYRKVPYVSGATIMGDGRVALILDANAIVRAA